MARSGTGWNGFAQMAPSRKRLFPDASDESFQVAFVLVENSPQCRPVDDQQPQEIQSQTNCQMGPEVNRPLIKKR